jgi:hypothetical protein
MHDLTAEYGQLNPIAFKFDSQVSGGTEAYWYYHYPMYQLAVEYLMDADGLGKSPEDVVRILTDMSVGTAKVIGDNNVVVYPSFSTAFGDQTGISVADYEEQFFDLMNEYLPERGNSLPVVPIGLVFFAVGAGLVFRRMRSRRRSNIFT